MFDIDYLRKRPEAFYTLADGLYPGEYEPTKFHRLMKVVQDQGYLRRLYTQNIDTLERIAGVDADYIVEAHGSFAESHCIDCGTEMAVADVKAEMRRDKHKGKIAVPRCILCGGIVKPDIVFFGEGLPRRFFDCMQEDLPEYADLVVVAGTSLTVHPFAQLPEMVNRDTVRVLFNAEQVGSLGARPNDVVVLGDCDKSADRFAELLGLSLDEPTAVTTGESEPEGDGEQASEEESSSSEDSSRQKQEAGSDSLQKSEASSPVLEPAVADKDTESATSQLEKLHLDEDKR